MEGKDDSESKRKMGKSRVRDKIPRTLLRSGKSEREADSHHKHATCSSCGKRGHMPTVCRDPTTHDVSDEHVTEVWSVAVDDGHCICTRHPAWGDEIPAVSRVPDR